MGGDDTGVTSGDFTGGDFAGGNGDVRHCKGQQHRANYGKCHGGNNKVRYM